MGKTTYHVKRTALIRKERTRSSGNQRTFLVRLNPRHFPFELEPLSHEEYVTTSAPMKEDLFEIYLRLLKTLLQAHFQFQKKLETLSK